ncbi:uncharacterized protein LOC127004363 [Eriocheir sinensis]|uniref:uncharacterized protein LOC127004363 n=1 Tax=Eriocheir sinensis TaxID=95602 RepID=UPI0021C65EA0|nr:uncharacterized protein LOC127004363 [Eriocheir sinensis]
MFSNGFFAFHPFSDPRDGFPLMGRRSRDWMRNDFPLMDRGPGDMVDKWMEILEPWSTGALVGEPSPYCSRPRTLCCPHTCLLDRPQTARHRLPRESLQHFVILPNLLSEPTRSEQEEGRARQSEKAAACSQKCQKKQAGSGQQAASSTDSAESKTSDKASGESPWHFSVDMSGCDEVRAMTDKGMLMVEGRGSSDTSQQMVRYITSLPRHISHDSLTANLNNGRLTVTQKSGTQQLEGQARTLPIDVQQQTQQKAPETTEPEQQEVEAAEKQQ